jgi:hypothetical protein
LRDPFLTFVDTTALLLSCFVPTLFAGSAETAAKLVPPSAASNASAESTVAGEGHFLRVMAPPPL